jgi:hypothetical protein
MKQDRTAVGTPEFWTDVLNLEGFEVVHHRHDPQENRWQFTVVPRVCAGVCPGCGEVSNAVHQTREWDDVHDLPIGDSRVELTVRTFQYRCAACERCFTPPSAALAEGTHATERFLERCAQLIRTGDVRNAATFFGLPCSQGPHRYNVSVSCVAGCAATCAGWCGLETPEGCWCDDECIGFGDCCNDACAECNVSGCDSSCNSSCGGTSPSGCWCDSACFGYNDCCDDVCTWCGDLSTCTCPPDLDGNGLVNVFDLLSLLGSWGPCTGYCAADFDGSGTVNVFDLLQLLGSWGPCP